jgi:hypothetical protein
MPKDLYQITPTAAENIGITGVWVTLQRLLHLQGQAIHPATHIGRACGQPDAHAGDAAPSRSRLRRGDASDRSGSGRSHVGAPSPGCARNPASYARRRSPTISLRGLASPSVATNVAASCLLPVIPRSKSTPHYKDKAVITVGIRKVRQKILISCGSKFANERFSHRLRQHDSWDDARPVGWPSHSLVVVWKPMPYKVHESRRHKFPKARYRVTNWPSTMLHWCGGEA